jgi:hypothetical protein
LIELTYIPYQCGNNFDEVASGRILFVVKALVAVESNQQGIQRLRVEVINLSHGACIVST